MKFEEMNPAPPVTSTRFRFTLMRSRRAYVSQLLLDRVQRPALDVALDPSQRLPDERQHESLDAEDENNACSGEQRPGEVAVHDPVDGAVDADRRRRQRADETEGDADP